MEETESINSSRPLTFINPHAPVAQKVADEMVSTFPG